MVGEAQFAAQRVGVELLGQRGEEQVFLLQQLRLQTLHAHELRAVRHRRARVNLRVVAVNAAVVAVAFLLAPFAGGVEVFERETERVNFVVAAGAERQFTVNLQALAHGGLADAGDLWRDFARVRHGQSGVRAEQRAQHPDAARDGRGARAVARDGVDACLRDEAAAMALRRGGHAAERIAAHAGDAVEAREPLVHRHEVAADEIPRVEVVPEDFGEEAFRLAHHADFEVAVVFRVKILRGRVRADLARAEPLAGEVLHEGVAARVFQHPVHLRAQHGGLGQIAFVREAEQLVVGHRRPEEVGQARGQLVGVQRARRGGGRRGFDEEKEVRRGQHGGERGLDGLGEGGLARAGFLEQRDLRGDFLRRHRTAESAAHELLEDFTGLRRFIHLADDQLAERAAMARGRPHGVDGADEFNPVHEQLRTREGVGFLHPKIFQHARDVVSVIEFHAGGLLREARGDFVNLRRGLRRVHVQLGDDLRLAAEGDRNLQAGRAVIIHPVRFEVR